MKFYSRHFDTVEINASFYRLPSAENFANWHSLAGDDFTFAVKLSRYLTHMKRLEADERTNEGVDRFCSRACELGDSLGVVLVQLPENFSCDHDRIINLVSQFKSAEKRYKMKFPLALELRHGSWFDAKTYALLKRLKVALVVNSSPDWPCVRQLTSDMLYIRFHGDKKLYSSSYSDKQLAEWARYIKDAEVRLVYCYFNNDHSAKAVENAKSLADLL